ncbi:hypothetical protein [Ureaplasma ceti]|uniref:Uncharacterized protein n=1 Tax=Ureaplasma ceti TaxID=3119530 RepID=A0ABP9U926_9BACT
MIKYKDLNNINFKTRKNFEELDATIDEMCKDLEFYKPLVNLCKEVHMLDLHYNVVWNFCYYNVYWICIGSNEPEAILGIDFIIIHYYIPSEDITSLRKPTPFYLIECGPSLRYKTHNEKIRDANAIFQPISALTLKRFTISSYATEKSDFYIYCCFIRLKRTIKLISQYFPNLLKEPSKYKNKAYCKVNNKYIKEMKKLGLFPDKNLNN